MIKKLDGSCKEKVEILNRLKDEMYFSDGKLFPWLAVLKSKLKDWKESQLIINKEMFGFLIFVVNTRNPEYVNKKFTLAIHGFLLDKLTDPKFSDNITFIIENIC
jgi:cytoskeleton-associated protein 5